MNRRQLLAGAGVVFAVGSWGARGAEEKSASGLSLAPVRAGMDRVTRITVCTRPFRPLGPRIEAEKFDAKTVIHNYGAAAAGRCSGGRAPSPPRWPWPPAKRTSR